MSKTVGGQSKDPLVSEIDRRILCWLPYTSVRLDKGRRLFCFPYAGGSAAMFRGWIVRLASVADVVPLQLPGRGGHACVDPFTSMSSLVEELAEVIAPMLDQPFAIFGHSMGALIGFELANYLEKNMGEKPVKLFVSGRGAPVQNATQLSTYNLPEPEFIAVLRELQGTPDGVLSDPVMIRAFLPLLRADFELVQTYRFASRTQIAVPIVVLAGTHDREVTAESLCEWRGHTAYDISVHMFHGNHFFIRNNEDAILRLIARELRDL